MSSHEYREINNLNLLLINRNFTEGIESVNEHRFQTPSFESAMYFRVPCDPMIWWNDFCPTNTVKSTSGSNESTVFETETAFCRPARIRKAVNQKAIADERSYWKGRVGKFLSQSLYTPAETLSDRKLARSANQEKLFIRILEELRLRHAIDSSMQSLCRSILQKIRTAKRTVA